MKMDGGVRAPWLCLAVDVEHTGQQFDFVSEQFQGDDAGEVGEVLIFDLTDRHGLFGGMEEDSILDGTVECFVQDDVDIGQTEGGLLDGQACWTVWLSQERHLPRATASAEMVIREEHAGVEYRGQDKGGGEMPQHTWVLGGWVQLKSV